MPIEVEYADTNPHGSAMADLRRSLDTASKAERKVLWDLLWNTVNGRFRSMSSSEYRTFLNARQAWRVHDGVAVYKTVDVPCFAYVAFEEGSTVVCLILGFCRSYLPSEEAWWIDVIQPRLV